MLELIAQTSNDGTGTIVFGLIMGLVVWGPIGLFMAKKRFRPEWLGYVLGAVIGVFGLIVIAIMGTKKGPACRACGRTIPLMRTGSDVNPARICLACGADQIALNQQQKEMLGRAIDSANADMTPPPPPMPVG